MNKRELYADIREYTHTDPILKIRLILEAHIKELRKKNDNASTRDVLKNQGAIEELKLIKKNLLGKEKFKEYNSGFDE